ncbi:hypothetical protein BV22DRAFT_896031 [Leucogyrophana mollusca]|uniref:Uncharacterized protein n=1 Tax=Leucogyrophana mollusca TaxID=85980 RepID=A0ACB8AZI1_9AGAM|nr:hypothetical protein BV22DRAFT_896031 [Leucogyrophana mollusca]
MAPSTSGIAEAARQSTEEWQKDLHSLFQQAKDRFPDVVWELGEGDEKTDEIWGHKAIVYARAPPSFQARYFQFRPAPIASPTPYSPSTTPGLPAQSSLSLSLTLDYSRSPSPYQSSPDPASNGNSVLRLPTNISPALFSNELEYLYTGKGLGSAFEFLFDSATEDQHEDDEDGRVDKLRKDLVFMWRSRLYSDVRIALSGNFSSSTPNHEPATAIFSSHRFILASRSPYFHTLLLTWPSAPTPAKGTTTSEPPTLTLPSPPFTPASLHFTLGYLYTGTLHFSHRTYDLSTAFALLRAATYLSLPALAAEVTSRLALEMLHGLFHAFLPFPAYESITGGKWAVGGCRCRQCARRAPRVLEFALAEDVREPTLERGARRALVGLFGEGWATPEFAALPPKVRESVLKGVGKRTTPLNAFALLFAAQHALRRLDAVIDAWADTAREMIIAGRRGVEECLVARAAECWEEDEWVGDVLGEDGEGTGFGDVEKVGWVMDAVRRGLCERWAAAVYQSIVSQILLRPHPTDPSATLLSATSPIRARVEETRVEVLRWLRRRWLGVREAGGFEGLEGWALKEIAAGERPFVAFSSLLFLCFRVWIWMWVGMWVNGFPHSLPFVSLRRFVRVHRRPMAVMTPLCGLVAPSPLRRLVALFHVRPSSYSPSFLLSTKPNN